MGMVVKRFLILAALMMMLATNANAESRGLTVQIRASEAKDAPVASEVKLYEKSYALVIGIDEYTNGWPRLSNAVKDARLIAEELEKKGFEVTRKTNLNAAELEKTFKEFFIIKGEMENARLFVWFAGHGHTNDGEGYLVPADAPHPSKSVTQFKLLALNMRRFGEFVRDANSKHVFNVFDSCFAGTVFNTQRSMPPNAITHATTQPVRQFLTSGDADQEVSDDGTFRKLFIRALEGGERADANSDGYITGSEMGMFLTDRMTNISRINQTPRYGKLNDEDYDRGDFVFKLTSVGKAPVVPRTPTIMVELEFWRSVKDSSDSAMFKEYLRQHPNGDFAGLARLKIKKLEGEKQTAFLPPPTNTIEEMDATFVALKTANLRENPTANSKKVGQVKIDTGLNVTGKVKGKNWYRVAHNGDTAFVFAPLVMVIDAIELEAWVHVTNSGDAKFFEAFLKAHPSGHFADRAKRRQEVLERTAKEKEWQRQEEEALRLAALEQKRKEEEAQRLAEAERQRQEEEARRLAALEQKRKEEEAQRLAEAERQRQEEEAPSPPKDNPYSAYVVPEWDDPPKQVAVVTPPKPTDANIDVNVMIARGDEARNLGNYNEAVKWYRKAAEQGNAVGQNNLGIMYSTGKGVDWDYSEAINWYRKAAEQGYAVGQNNLGYMYHTGKGVDRDYSEAINWYRKAAEQGYGRSQAVLGLFYRDGLGVDEDHDEARKWLQKSVDHGFLKAKEYLSTLD
jgi:TPR repeat protein